jgi:hypothetical protein
MYNAATTPEMQQKAQHALLRAFDICQVLALCTLICSTSRRVFSGILWLFFQLVEVRRLRSDWVDSETYILVHEPELLLHRRAMQLLMRCLRPWD